MYVSRAVEGILDDPVEGVAVRLVLEPAPDAERDAVAAAAEAAGATVERELQFGDLEVSAAQVDVADVCLIEGLAAVQTADAIGTHPDDVEEDVDRSALE